MGIGQPGVDSTGDRVCTRTAMLHVQGSPIGGENPPHEQRWRAAIAAAATTIEPAAAVQLHFRLEPHRKIDLDNLVRPALAGLRDAGVLTRGYRSLDAMLATKTSADDEVGVDIDPTTVDVVIAVEQPTVAAMVVADTVLPKDGDRSSKRHWRDTVGRQQAPIEDNAVWLDIAVNTALSLEGLLKPIIDGLDPVLGIDPTAILEFTPNDDRVEWLRIHRQLDLPCALVLAAGSMPA